MAKKADPPSAFGIDRKFGSDSGFGTLGGPTSASRTAGAGDYTSKAGSPKARPAGQRGKTVAAGRLSDEGSFVDRAKGNAAKTVKKAKTAAVVSSSSPKPRPESAPRKGGLAGLLGAFKANKGNNEKLALERMAKAARKG